MRNKEEYKCSMCMFVEVCSPRRLGVCSNFTPATPETELDEELDFLEERYEKFRDDWRDYIKGWD